MDEGIRAAFSSEGRSGLGAVPSVMTGLVPVIHVVEYPRGSKRNADAFETTIACGRSLPAWMTGTRPVMTRLHMRVGVRAIRDDDDYSAALEDIERYFDDEPEPGTPEADEFTVKLDLIAAYEAWRRPIES